MKKIFYNLYRAAEKTIDHDGVEHSGYMSFMVILSIFPFLIFFLALTSFFGASQLGEHFIRLLLENMPEQTAGVIKNRIAEIIQTPPESLLTLAIVGSIWTASSFVECLRTILNRVNEIKSPPPYVTRRLLSIVQFFIISAMISFAMFLLVFIPIALRKLPFIMELIAGYEDMINISRYFLILLCLFLGVSLLYYIIPNTRVRFWEVIPGAAITVILWVISGYLLSKYIIYYNQLNVVYGSLGSIIITLLFFYIMNMIFIYGAEFNYLLKKND